MCVFVYVKKDESKGKTVSLTTQRLIQRNKQTNKQYIQVFDVDILPGFAAMCKTNSRKLLISIKHFSHWISIYQIHCSNSMTVNGWDSDSDAHTQHITWLTNWNSHLNAKVRSANYRQTIRELFQFAQQKTGLSDILSSFCLRSPYLCPSLSHTDCYAFSSYCYWWFVIEFCSVVDSEWKIDNYTHFSHDFTC